MIEWTEQAARQLERACDYMILSGGEEIAARTTENIVSRVQQLGVFPMSGRPGRVTSTRELVILNSPYIVAYTIQKERIVILAIYHGAQRWPEAF